MARAFFLCRKDDCMFEKVNPAHPDKIADRIAGAIVDLAYDTEENPKIAVEVLIGHGVCHVVIETTADLKNGKDQRRNPQNCRKDCVS